MITLPRPYLCLSWAICKVDSDSAATDIQPEWFQDSLICHTSFFRDVWSRWTSPPMTLSNISEPLAMTNVGCTKIHLIYSPYGEQEAAGMLLHRCRIAESVSLIFGHLWVSRIVSVGKCILHQLHNDGSSADKQARQTSAGINKHVRLTTAVTSYCLARSKTASLSMSTFRNVICKVHKL